MSELPRVIADVYELAGALRRRGDELAGAVGQTQARWQVLSVLSGDDLTVALAARRLGVSRQAVQRVADALTAEGLLRFEANPRDRRAPLARLTTTGTEALVTINRAAARWHRAVTAQMGDSELSELRASLRRLLDVTGDLEVPYRSQR
jgi:DNA-binding MarR family transcriptional regulator